MRVLRSSSYHEFRPEIRCGDLVFFAGDSALSKVIRLVTGDPTHVAIAQRLKEAESDVLDRVWLIESTTLNRWAQTRGVQSHLLSEKLKNESEQVTVWVARLSDAVRRRMNQELWADYLKQMKGKRYDYIQAVGSALGQLLPLLPSISLKTSLYCSELAAGCLRVSGAIPSNWDPTPTPWQMAVWDIYSEVVHIQGPPRVFPSVKVFLPEHWY